MKDSTNQSSDVHNDSYKNDDFVGGNKVDGSCIFIHRLLMEHFSYMTNEDIKRVASQVK